MRAVATSENPSVDAGFANRVNSDSGNNLRKPSNGKANPIHAMVAGYLAGSSGTIVGYPLDSLKVWVQTNSIGKNKHLEGSSSSKMKLSRPKGSKDASSTKKCETTRGCKSSKHGSSNFWQTSSKKVRSGSSRRSNSTKAIPFPASSIGVTTAQHRVRLLSQVLAKPLAKAYGTIRALYSGVAGPLMTVGMVQSVNFATYDATRRFLYRRKAAGNLPKHSQNPREYLTNDSLYCVAASGSVGGMATAIMTAPLLMIKIRQQITGNSWRTAVREIFVVEGPSGRMRFRPFQPYGAAFVPHAMSEAIGRAIYVTVYEGCKRSMARSKGGSGSDGTRSLSLRERMLCAAASGICCWGTFFPLDALRNRMYDAVTRKTPGAGSIVGTLRAMRAERAFYRGFSISIVRAGPVAAAVLPVYDMTLEKLSSWK